MIPREDTDYIAYNVQRPPKGDNKNTIVVVIFIGITVLIVILVPLINYLIDSSSAVQITNESLLFAVLIFGIYLVLLGKISQLKFMDFEVQIKDAVGKPPKILDTSNLEIQADEIRSEAGVPKESTEFLENTIKPQLAENAKLYTNPILRLTGTENKSDSGYGKRYNPSILLDYLKYFNYVIFVDYYGRLYGFSAASEISKEIEGNPEFVSKINKWELDSSPVIRKNAYVEEHTSRKQVLAKMQELGLDTLPVVSEGKRYVGVTQKDIIVMGIAKDLYARYIQS